jgi:very-short-patch-repair endonuclease
MARGVKLEPKNCEACGRSFGPGKGEGGERWRRRRYCSNACYQTANRGTNWKVRKVRQCLVCGDDFQREREDHNVVTCPKPECRAAYRKVSGQRRSETMRQQYASGEREVAGARERALWPLLSPHGWQWRLRWTDAVSPFELDFALMDLKLNIEIDGPEHQGQPHYRKRDARRDSELERRGWKILRIPNADVDESPERVAERVLAWADSHR